MRLCPPLLHHRHDVKKVLQTLKHVQLICGPTIRKMFLGCRVLCGSVLKNGTRHPSPSKLIGFALEKRPQTITPLQAFTGCCNLYHTFITMHAKVVGFLTELLKGLRNERRKGTTVTVKLTTEWQQAYIDLKRATEQAVTLHVPDPTKCFYLRTNTSNYAIGCVVEQVDPRAGEHRLLLCGVESSRRAKEGATPAQRRPMPFRQCTKWTHHPHECR